MRFLAAAITFLAPLALAPGWFFYYDITPKACLLYLGTALLAAFSWFARDALQQLRASRHGRWYIWFACGMAAVAAITASSSPVPALAWQGSTWRRGGAITEITTVTAALLISAGACASREWLFAVLRALCGAGLLASIYGIAQYFGWDPWLPKSAYEVGEGIYQIVRPPSTLGHSDYFAAFLLWPVFAGLGLASTPDSATVGRASTPDSALAAGNRRAWRPGLLWRSLGAASAVAGAVAVALSGSRGALLGLAVGACALAWFRRPRLRVAGIALVALAAAAGLFYISPAGARLRARVFWISEDRAGGARLLLWRDSLRMSAERPFLGYGPDAFAAEFPKFQSRELARAYPDFYHESPHNIFLDALTAEGIAGLALLLAMTLVGFSAGWPTARSDAVSATLLAALLAAVVAQQFVVFVIPTALAFYLGVGLLCGAGSQPAAPRLVSAPLAVCGIALAGILVWQAHRTGSGDRALLTMERSLRSGDVDGSVRAYQSLEAHRPTGVTADLAISRLAAAAAAKAAAVPAKLVFAQLAASAARAATQAPEQKQNAWYNLAVLQAPSNDATEVEKSLRAAIAASPNWYKPHWMLARVLASTGRLEAARREAALALDLDGGKHDEVRQTLEPIVRSAQP